MILSLGLALAGVAAAPVAQSDPKIEPQSDIVVTGRRLTDTRSALDQCIARACPPREEVAATIAHAENLFVAGDYDEAGAVTARGLGRNRRYAEELPHEVSSLLRAHSNIAAHRGRVGTRHHALLDMRDVLKRGTGAEGSSTLMAQLELTEGFLARGKLYQALSRYDGVAKAADRAGEHRVAATALLRKAVVLSVLASTNRDFNELRDTALRRVLDLKGPEMQPYVEAAGLVMAQDAASDGRPEELERVIAAAQPRDPALPPQLLFNPPFRTDDEAAGRQAGGMNSLNDLGEQNVDGQWMDVGFRILGDGTVDEVEILRRGPRTIGNWQTSVAESIGARRYAPIALAEGEGLRRVERYTRTATFFTAADSRMRRRSPFSRIEVLDLTDDLPVQTR